MKWKTRPVIKLNIIILDLYMVGIILFGMFTGFPSYILPLYGMAIIWLFYLPRHFFSFTVDQNELILRTGLFYKKRIPIDQIEHIYPNYHGFNQVVIDYDQHKYITLYTHKTDKEAFIAFIQVKNTSYYDSRNPLKPYEHLRRRLKHNVVSNVDPMFRRVKWFLLFCKGPV